MHQTRPSSGDEGGSITEADRPSARWQGEWPADTLALAQPALMSLPDGVVTFPFTDVEGSTRLWQDLPDVMMRALEQHDGVIDAAVEACCRDADWDAAGGVGDSSLGPGPNGVAYCGGSLVRLES